MHPSSSSAAATTEAPLSVLDQINPIISLLIVSSLSVKTFTGRWQTIRSRLTSLQTSLTSLTASPSPHWSSNPLLLSLLPNLLSLLRRLHSLLTQCSSPSYPGGKLLMQSDLDIASSSLSDLLHSLDLLLRSGVLQVSNAIVLSQPGLSSNKEDVVLFVKDLFTRLQIGGVEFKQKALESLLQLLSVDEKSAGIVVREGNISYLVHLLDLNGHYAIRELALSAVSVLASCSEESRKSIFEAGALGTLLRLLEAGSVAMKEKAAAAVEAITSDLENAWAISAYGGVSVLLEACRSVSPVTQSHAVGAIRNVAVVDDVRVALAEEAGVPVLVQLLSSSSAAAQEKASCALATLAESGEYFRALIVQERGLQKLLRLIGNCSGSEALESVLRAISSLSASAQVSQTLSSSTAFIVQNGELIKHGNLRLQHTAVSLLANLSISDGNKRAISSSTSSLVKLMESPKPVGLNESAAKVLVELLSVRSNRKELVKDEKSVTRLVHMMDPANEAVAAKRLPVMVLAAISDSHGCRKRLLAAGAYPHLLRLAEMDVPGARKLAQRLAGSKIKSLLGRTWRD
ncbi:hypothetical protein MLD38_033420 [Melastoma candidum]|uniref:Uncharacterized protein n=2 Tax=Melastoma candidum TaxID=119954 RepID=A0ACB9M6H3_9MYRT|nr:hypothetical protein MLD38_033420 [Melastoma candidum]